MAIPSSFALDNETSVIGVDSNVTAVQLPDNSDVLQASNDYYFDASVEKDTGDGTIDNPYKYLTANRIKSNSNIHLANGEYKLNQRVSTTGVTIIGSDVTKTIILYDGYGINVQSSLTLKNVTLSGITIANNGRLVAENSIFENGKGYTEDSYGNNFGGAIYTPYDTYAAYYGYGTNHELSLTNCTFRNNYAEYGGAIFMDTGYLSVYDTLFINNSAYNYGGAIALEYNIKSTISGSSFINDSSINDAGGAIYLRESPLTIEDSTFSDCFATFGSGVTSLSSDVYAKSIKGYDNVAKYNGGVFYHMYGTFSMSDSSFNNNSAHNGAALFIDNSTSFTLLTTNFINNKADYCAGAVYSLLNNLKRGNSVKDTITGNVFMNNTAVFMNDEYEVNDVDLNIGNGNYTLYKVNSTDIGVLPSQYSLIDLGLVSPVKDQQTSGNCWAFTAIAALESCILKASGDVLDLSEEHMKNMIELYSDYGWAMDTNNGGYDNMPMGYLTSWLGPVFEEDDITDDRSTVSPVLDSVMHVQNILFLKRDSYTDNDAIKEAVMKYGAVATGIYYDDSYRNGYSYYYYGSSYSNHAVTIVGWDDTYSRTKFAGSPQGNGAWIVKNSWGPEWANNGYFYVSYYDTRFAQVGVDASSYTFILNDTIRYDKNYQYDIAGMTDYFTNSSSSVWYKNIFTSTDNELLAAVSTYFEKVTDWDVSIIVNDAVKLTKSGTSNPGYYTIDLGELIPLKLGDVFEVVFHISVDGDAGVPISEKISLNKLTYRPETSFISYDGNNWKDLYDLKWSYSTHTYSSQVACIKAFTTIAGIETSTILNVAYDKFNPVNITAVVYDEYGKLVKSGNVTFILNGQEFVVNVSEGIASLVHNFDKKQNDVSVIYSGIGFISSANSTVVNISQMDVSLDLDIVKNLNAAIVNVQASNPINTTVTVSINNKNYTVELVDGKGTVELEELDKGSYDVKAFLDNKEIFISEDVSDLLEIDVITTEIISADMVTDDLSGEIYSITLVNKFGGPLADKNVKFILNNQVYNVTTDSEGKASIPVNLEGGLYNISTIFEGSDEYMSFETVNSIKVKDKINVALSITQNINDVVVTVSLSKKINETVNVAVNNQNFTVNAVDGVASLSLSNLANNQYDVIADLANDEDFISNQSDLQFTINVNDLIIVADEWNTTDFSGENYEILLTDLNSTALSGKEVTFELNGVSFTTATDDRGIASIPVSLAGGNYKVTVNFNGDNDFFKNTAAANIKVKDKVDITFTVSKDSNNALINVKLSKSIDEKVQIVINGKKYIVDAVNGRAPLQLSNLENGEFNVSVSLIDSDDYISEEVSSSFLLNIEKTNIIASDKTVGDYSNAVYSVNLIDENNNPVANKKITFVLNDVTYTRTTDDKGIASIPLNLAVGSYDVMVSFDGDDDYFKSSISSKINVIYSVSANMTITQSLNNVVIDVTLSKAIDDDFIVTVNGTTYSVKSSNGKVSLSLTNLDNGNYVVNVDSDKYNTHSSSNFNIDVNINIVAGNFTTYYMSGSNYTITLMNNNESVSGKTLTITLNGVTYTRTTDADGNMVIPIELATGTYNINIIDFEHNVVKSQTIEVVPTLSSNKDLTKYYGSTNKYSVLVLGDDAKPVADAIVVMKINGKTYNVKSDSKGIAALNVDLKPNKYTITAEYKGYKVSNKVTVKTTLVTKNISKKKAATTKFTAKLLNNKGKILKNKKITFKFKGKTYKVKTNSKGIATLSLKSLKVGKHTITSTYGKLSVKNIITIKK